MMGWVLRAGWGIGAVGFGVGVWSLGVGWSVGWLSG